MENIKEQAVATGPEGVIVLGARTQVEGKLRSGLPGDQDRPSSPHYKEPRGGVEGGYDFDNAETVEGDGPSTVRLEKKDPAQQ